MFTPNEPNLDDYEPVEVYYNNITTTPSSFKTKTPFKELWYLKSGLEDKIINCPYTNLLFFGFTSIYQKIKYKDKIYTIKFNHGNYDNISNIVKKI